MQIEQKQFDKAQKFVIEQLENSEKTKEGLLEVVNTIEEEWRNAENIDYQRSLMAIVYEMNLSVKEFKKENQSQ